MIRMPRPGHLGTPPVPPCPPGSYTSPDDGACYPLVDPDGHCPEPTDDMKKAGVFWIVAHGGDPPVFWCQKAAAGGMVPPPPCLPGWSTPVDDGNCYREPDAQGLCPDGSSYVPINASQGVCQRRREDMPCPSGTQLSAGRCADPSTIPVTQDEGGHERAVVLVGVGVFALVLYKLAGSRI